MTADFPRIRARELFSPARLDLMVKYMWFRAQANGVLEGPAQDLYRRHIMARTGGSEPADLSGKVSPKTSFDAYIEHAHTLLNGMQSRGYDPGAAVPLGCDGLPLNGAHRIACAAWLGLDVALERHEREGIAWDMRWFLAHGFSRSDLALMLREYVLLTAERTMVCVLWGPALRHWQDITALIMQRCSLAGYLDFAFGDFEASAFRSLLYDTYAQGIRDHCDGMPHIERKLGWLEGAPRFYRVVVASVPVALAAQTWQLSRAMKEEIRRLAAATVPVEKFITCHTAECVEETRHLATTLLDPYNLEAVRLRSSERPRAEFLHWLTRYEDTIRAAGIDPEDCCVVGSAPLEVCGIRPATDIDFTVRANVRQRLFGAAPSGVAPAIDVVSEGYHRTRDGVPYSDDRLIDDPALHFRFHGFKFANLDIVRSRKTYSRRPKDVLDVELIDRFRGRLR